ncbi:hypothetical protein WG66_015059 [Moniliophthora roreri]|nr:hypothetical protein WG66_015059 [Moniliophthora roreri]
MNDTILDLILCLDQAATIGVLDGKKHGRRTIILTYDGYMAKNSFYFLNINQWGLVVDVSAAYYMKLSIFLGSLFSVSVNPLVSFRHTARMVVIRAASVIFELVIHIPRVVGLRESNIEPCWSNYPSYKYIGNSVGRNLRHAKLPFHVAVDVEGRHPDWLYTPS